MRSPGPDERGVTVVESAMTLSILAIALVLVFSAFGSMMNGFAGSDERTVNLAEGRLIMERTTRDIRTAFRLDAASSPFLVAKPNEIAFFANLGSDGRPTKVHFFIDATSTLVEEGTPADAASSAPNYTFTGAPVVRMVGTYVVNGSGPNPPFEFFDLNNVLLAFDPTCSCLAATDLPKVNAVGIRFAVRRSTSLSVQPTTILNRVRLPNVDYNPLTVGGP